jgi:hypothetical protein
MKSSAIFSKQVDLKDQTRRRNSNHRPEAEISMHHRENHSPVCIRSMDKFIAEF